MAVRKHASLVAIIAMVAVTLPATASAPLEDYVVVLEPGNRAPHEVAREVAAEHGGSIGFIYTTALRGFTLEIPAAASAALERNPNVAYIEPVVEVEAFGTQPIPTGIDRIDGDVNPPTVPMDVDIAILDTGVYIGQRADGSSRSHLDLNLRYVSDCTGAVFYPLFGGCSGSGDFQDYHGHGTHVAGIAAALDNDIGTIGVAPGATLHSFKVLQADGTGTSGMILAGIDAVASRADVIEVANMSLGFEGTSQAIDDAIANATNVGVLFVVAAGNSAIDASLFSPANSPDSLAVSALADFDGLPGGLGAPTCRVDQDDTLADFSNFGPIVDVAAPGVCIFSTDLNDGYSVKSGTSMASPFVAGAAARYIAETGHPTNDRADVESIKAALLGAAAPQSSACGFADVDNHAEPLLFVNGPAFQGDGTCGGSPPPVGNTAPTAAFSHSCDGLDCSFVNESFDPDPGDTLTYSWSFGDGSGSTAESPSKTFGGPGTYPVELTVNDGTASDAVTTNVVVEDAPPANQPPTASFTANCTDLTCDFTSTSTDPDAGTSLTHSWTFGDGMSSSTTHPTHEYASAGTYTVELTVGDGELSDSTSQVLVVTDPPVASEVSATPSDVIQTDRVVEALVAVFDDLGDFVGGATVEGTLTYADRRGRERTTTLSGVSADHDLGYGILVVNAVLDKRLAPGSSVTGFCVTSVTAPGYTYVQTGFECWPVVPLDASKMSVRATTVAARLD